MSPSNTPGGSRLPRREMLRDTTLAGIGIWAAGGGLETPSAARAAETPRPEKASLRCLDYGRSFLCNTAAFNAVQFWVESRTTIVDEKAGGPTQYYQCASCKSEDTFARENLFLKNNYDFLPVFGDGRWLIFRRPAGLHQRYRQIATMEKMWGPPNLKLHEATDVTVLDTWEKIRDASAQGLPLVAQTALADAETGMAAIIECPIKTMNVSLQRKLYQVDTGPIALPDLTKRYEPQIDCLRLAFVAFNTPDFADFIVEQPTPVLQDGKEVTKIYHYSSPFSLPARNTVLALGRLAS